MTSETERYEISVDAKVAALVTDTQLAFNVGAKMGIEPGNAVAIVRDVHVDDPDTKSRLGTVRLVRLKLEVNYVQDNLCVARVTDVRSRQMPLDITAVPTLRRVALGSEDRTDDSTVFVVIGEPAVITTSPRADDEPPF